MELSSCLLLFCDRNVKVLKSLIEVVELKVQQTSKKEQAWLKLLFAAATNGNIQKLKSLLDFILLLNVVNELISHGIAIAPNDTDGIETERVLVVRESEARLPKKLAGHQIFFGVHF